MRKMFLLATTTIALATAGAANATNTVSDPTGDFLASYTGPHEADLDVTSFSVSYNASMQSFLIQATLAGNIDASTPGLYAIGVNTGTGTARPFAGIGEPNVIFNQVIAVQKTGTGAIGATALDPSSILIGGNAFSVMIPLSLLPTTGFAPGQYGFNLWPRDGAAGNGAISDFSPENATLAAAPEPATWAMMLGGFALTGSALRRRKGAAAISPAA